MASVARRISQRLSERLGARHRAGDWKIDAELSRQQISTAEEEVNLVLTVKAPKHVSEVPAMNICFLLDTSGSMIEDKVGEQQDVTRYEALGTAMTNFVGGLAERDQVALITFANDSKLRFPFQHVTESTKEGFRRAVDSITCFGQTNLEKGLATACAHISELEARAQGSQKVLFFVICDGEITSGEERASPLAESIERWSSGLRYTSVIPIFMMVGPDPLPHFISALSKGCGSESMVAALVGDDQRNGPAKHFRLPYFQEQKVPVEKVKCVIVPKAGVRARARKSPKKLMDLATTPHFKVNVKTKDFSSGGTKRYAITLLADKCPAPHQDVELCEVQLVNDATNNILARATVTVTRAAVGGEANRKAIETMETEDVIEETADQLEARAVAEVETTNDDGDSDDGSVSQSLEQMTNIIDELIESVVQKQAETLNYGRPMDPENQSRFNATVEKLQVAKAHLAQKNLEDSEMRSFLAEISSSIRNCTLTASQPINDRDLQFLFRKRSELFDKLLNQWEGRVQTQLARDQSESARQ